MTTSNTAPDTAASDELLLTAREAALHLRLTQRALSRLRREGGGPAFFKFGKRVRYGRDDLSRWLIDHRHETAPSNN